MKPLVMVNTFCGDKWREESCGYEADREGTTPELYANVVDLIKAPEQTQSNRKQAGVAVNTSYTRVKGEGLHLSHVRMESARYAVQLLLMHILLFTRVRIAVKNTNKLLLKIRVSMVIRRSGV